MRRLLRWVALPALLAAAAGCGRDSAPNSGPSPRPSAGTLLAPFAGEWVCELEKTLDAQKAAGAPGEELERLRKLYSKNPQFAKMHPDMTITGNVAVCAGVPSSEYRFFAIHEHGGKLCAKAWHHEDRFDPGDMTKCYVRMEIRDRDLYMEVRMQNGLPDLNDPDLRATPPPELGSVAGCDADSPAGGEWTKWTTYVFTKRR